MLASIKHIITKRTLLVALPMVLMFMAILSVVIYDVTKAEVQLTINNETIVVSTHADTVGDLLEDKGIPFEENDFIQPSLETEISKQMDIVYKTAIPVTISSQSGEEVIWTVKETVHDVLEEQGIIVQKYDHVSPKLDDPIQENLVIHVDRAFQVTVDDAGENHALWTTSTTVADFLEANEIKLSTLDRIEPALEDLVTTDTSIRIVRVKKITDVVEESTDYAVVTKKDKNLLKGSKKVVQEGNQGKIEKQYEVTLENGKEVSRKLLETTTVLESKPKIVAVGTKEAIVALSRSQGSSKEFYVTATAYTAYCKGCSGVTNTGIDLRENPGMKVIAVDPRVIPLGTKVHVEGYGYAVAGDIGSAIKGNKIDVFIPERSKALNWGVRKVKIKIIDSN